MKVVESTAPAPARKLEQEGLLTDREVADWLGVALQTVRNWRCRHEGPRWVRLGKRLVRYPASSVRAFIEGREPAAAEREAA